MAEFLDLGKGQFLNIDRIVRVRSNVYGEQGSDVSIHESVSRGTVQVIIDQQGGMRSDVYFSGDEAKILMAYFDQHKKT